MATIVAVTSALALGGCFVVVDDDDDYNDNFHHSSNNDDANDDHNYAAHNDNAYNRGQPEFVGLLCLQSAVEGGRSGVASIRAVHNDLLRQHPAALARLYQPFLFDRQKEHAAGEPGAVSAPIFASDKGVLGAIICGGVGMSCKT